MNRQKCGMTGEVQRGMNCYAPIDWEKLEHLEHSSLSSYGLSRLPLTKGPLSFDLFVPDLFRECGEVPDLVTSLRFDDVKLNM